MDTLPNSEDPEEMTHNAAVRLSMKLNYDLFAST